MLNVDKTVHKFVARKAQSVYLEEHSEHYMVDLAFMRHQGDPLLVKLFKELSSVHMVVHQPRYTKI